MSFIYKSRISNFVCSISLNDQNGLILTTRQLSKPNFQTQGITINWNNEMMIRKRNLQTYGSEWSHLNHFIFVNIFRFCVGDKFFLKNNMILCQTDYEEGLMKEGYAPQVRWSINITPLRIQSTPFFYLFCSTCI